MENLDAKIDAAIDRLRVAEGDDFINDADPRTIINEFVSIKDDDVKSKYPYLSFTDDEIIEYVDSIKHAGNLFWPSVYINKLRKEYDHFNSNNLMNSRSEYCGKSYPVFKLDKLNSEAKKNDSNKTMDYEVGVATVKANIDDKPYLDGYVYESESEYGSKLTDAYINAVTRVWDNQHVNIAEKIDQFYQPCLFDKLREAMNQSNGEIITQFLVDNIIGWFDSIDAVCDINYPKYLIDKAKEIDSSFDVNQYMNDRTDNPYTYESYDPETNTQTELTCKYGIEWSDFLAATRSLGQFDETESEPETIVVNGVQYARAGDTDMPYLLDPTPYGEETGTNESIREINSHFMDADRRVFKKDNVHLSDDRFKDWYDAYVIGKLYPYSSNEDLYEWLDSVQSMDDMKHPKQVIEGINSFMNGYSNMDINAEATVDDIEKGIDDALKRIEDHKRKVKISIIVSVVIVVIALISGSIIVMRRHRNDEEVNEVKNEEVNEEERE